MVIYQYEPLISQFAEKIQFSLKLKAKAYGFRLILTETASISLSRTPEDSFSRMIIRLHTPTTAIENDLHMVKIRGSAQWFPP